MTTNEAAQPEANFTIFDRDRIVEGRTVVVRDRKKAYALHVLITERTSRRGVKRRSAQIEAPVGVPIPGKGENSWDCGDDRLYGLSCQADTVKEAVERFVDEVRGIRRGRR